MRGGYFRVYRTLFDPAGDWHPSSTGEPANRAYAWLDMISMAHYESGGGLERGQLFGSARTFGERWNWKRTKAGEFLKSLADAKAIEVRTRGGRNASVITICNYDTYQLDEENERTRSRSSADAKPPEVRTRRSNKKEKQQYLDDFEAVWKAWKGRPNNNKQAALKAYNARRNEGTTADEIKDGVVRYWKYLKAAGKLGSEFMKTAATFFGPDKHWENEYGKPMQNDMPLLNAKQ